MGGKLLRILCLHGMSQNETLFRKRTAAFHDALKGIAELVYITAPMVVTEPEIATLAEPNAAKYMTGPDELKPHAWWIIEPFKPVDSDGFFYGTRDSLEYIKDVLLEQGPFDGIMGFSQGGSLAAILTELLEDRSLMPGIIPPDFPHPPMRFAILSGAFIPPSTQVATRNVLFSRPGKVKTPSLHTMGETDNVIPPERIAQLITRFTDPVVIAHPGGHVVPSDSAALSTYASFVSKFMQHEASPKAHL